MEARKITMDLEKYFRVRRVETEEGAFLECRYKKGTQKIKFQTERENISGLTAILLGRIVFLLGRIVFIVGPNCLIFGPSWADCLGPNCLWAELSNSPINYAEKGYEIRPRGNEPVLPYGDLTICGQRAIIKEPKPIMRKITKQTGELHLSGLPLEIPLKDKEIWFEEKFGIKVENAKFGEAFGFSI
ncbi:hypothetical protein ACJMK2_003195 [Sinanodonta woodiana]|uniref:Uncharacterized protein n=1 Tax=Sinanodonta woodiana TaxID=1069815 RepID=A0ABD3XXJ0_SINWO